MSAAEFSMDAYSEQTGWNVESQLKIALEYIDDNCDPNEFDEYLYERAQEEKLDEGDEEDE